MNPLFAYHQLHESLIEFTEQGEVALPPEIAYTEIGVYEIDEKVIKQERISWHGQTQEIRLRVLTAKRYNSLKAVI